MPLRTFPRSLAVTAALSAALLPAATLPLLAGETPVEPGPVFVPEIDHLGVTDGPVFVPVQYGAADAVTARVVEEIALAQDYCSWIPEEEYVIDCLADQLDAVADLLPQDDAAYAQSRAALEQASRSLAAIVDQNASRSQAPAVFEFNDPQSPRRSSRPLRAVDTAALPAARDAAIGVIEETGTILLRSAAQSDNAAHFQQVAAAIASNTLLLRSL